MKITKISKTLVACFSTLIITSTLAFAQNTNADEYEEIQTKNLDSGVDEYEDQVIIIPDTENSQNTATQKTKIKNPFEGMFSSKQSNYNFYDTIELNTGTFALGIKHRQAEVFVDPKTKKAGIQTYYQTSFFNFMFDEKDIALIAEAYEKYLQDFDNKALIRNNTMKTRKIYSNKGKCRVEWGTLKSMMNNFGDAKFHIGYEFKNKSPYFCIIVKDAKNLATDMGSNIAEKSVEVQLYFTKAEAKRFLEVLNPTVVKANTPNDTGTFDEY